MLRCFAGPEPRGGPPPPPEEPWEGDFVALERVRLREPLAGIADHLDAEVDRGKGVLRVNAVHEFLPFEPEEHDMVRAELLEMAEWLGVEFSQEQLG